MGWLIFAAIMLVLTGLFSFFEAVATLFPSRGGYADRAAIIAFDATTWSLLMLVAGVVMGLIGVGLLSAHPVVRAAGVAVACLHAVSQFAGIPAYPMYSLLTISLDVVVIFALTVHWFEPDDDAVGDTVDVTALAAVRSVARPVATAPDR